MLFSVVIPTYNRAALLKHALNSVLIQEFDDFEIIVVDDGSTDDTNRVVESLGRRVRFFRQDNSGPGVARNLGIQHASGEYVAFLDSDDVWFPWTLAVHARVIRQRGRPSLIAGRGVALENCGRMEELRHPLYAERYPDMLSACQGATPPVGGTSSIVVDVQLVRRIGGFCKDFVNCEDTDLWLRLAEANGFVRIQEPVLFAQRYHADTMTSDLDRSVRGALFLVHRESIGCYPGGKKYARRRRRIIAATGRNVSLECLGVGQRRMAWRLFKATLRWNLQLGRFRYLAGFPLLALSRRIRTAFLGV